MEVGETVNSIVPAALDSLESAYPAKTQTFLRSATAPIIRKGLFSNVVNIMSRADTTDVHNPVSQHPKKLSISCAFIIQMLRLNIIKFVLLVVKRYVVFGDKKVTAKSQSQGA